MSDTLEAGHLVLVHNPHYWTYIGGISRTVISCLCCFPLIQHGVTAIIQLNIYRCEIDAEPISGMINLVLVWPLLEDQS